MRRRLDAQVQRAGNTCSNSLMGFVAMQAQFTPQEVSTKASKHEIGICDGRFTSPVVITHGPWISASRLWPHLQAATGSQARNAPAAGPKAMDVDHWERQG